MAMFCDLKCAWYALIRVRIMLKNLRSRKECISKALENVFIAHGQDPSNLEQITEVETVRNKGESYLTLLRELSPLKK